MADEPQPGVLGSLPHTRPHRRSDKRGRLVADRGAADASPDGAAPGVSGAPVTRPAKPQGSAPKARATTARPQATSAKSPPRPPEPAANPGAVETAIQAAAELTEIGLQAGARALRRTLSRLPRP